MKKKAYRYYSKHPRQATKQPHVLKSWTLRTWVQVKLEKRLYKASNTIIDMGNSISMSKSIAFSFEASSRPKRTARQIKWPKHLRTSNFEQRSSPQEATNRNRLIFIQLLSNPLNEDTATITRSLMNNAAQRVR